MSMKKEDEQFLELIQRSKDIGNGWKIVSEVLRNFVENKVVAMPKLVEKREVNGVLQIRLIKIKYDGWFSHLL